MPRDMKEEIDGDIQFMGINNRLDPSALPAGMASDARNMRFRNGVASTRKGVYKPAWANNFAPEVDNKVRPFGTVHGVGVFRNPDSNLEFIIIAADGKAYYTRQGNNPIELALPTGVVLTGEVNFTQAFNKIIMFRGEDFAPLVMTSEDTGFVDMVEQWDSTKAYAVDDEVAFGPLVSVTSISYSGGTATVTTAAQHNYKSNADVTIAGANEAEFNGRFSITKTGDTTFTYLTTSSNSAATGTITCTNNKEYYKCSTITSAGESPSTASSKWTQLSTIMPNSTHGVHIANRIVTPTKYDSSTTAYGNKTDFIACSDSLDHAHTFFDQLFRINFGSNSEIKDLVPYDENRLLVFKDRDVHMVTGFIFTDSNSTLSTSASVQQIIQNYGAVNRGAAIAVGSDVYFYASRRGIVSLSQTEQSKVRGVDLPISEPIQKLIDRIDAVNESKIRLAYWDNKLWIACPIDGGNNGDNNCLIIYDFLNQQWVGHDDGTAINPKEFFIAEYNNSQRLYYIGTDGFINLVEERFEADDVADLTEADGLKNEGIESFILTRGYGQPSIDHKKYRSAAINISTWNPKYTLKTLPDGINESQVLVTDRTKSRQEFYRPFGSASYELSNRDDNANAPYRQDYSVGLDVDLDEIQDEDGNCINTEAAECVLQAESTEGYSLGANGVKFGQMQQTMESFSLTPRNGRYTQLELTNTQGRIELTQAHLTSSQGDRTIGVKA